MFTLTNARSLFAMLSPVEQDAIMSCAVLVAVAGTMDTYCEDAALIFAALGIDADLSASMLAGRIAEYLVTGS